MQGMKRGAVSIDARDGVIPVPIIDKVLRHRDALEYRLGGPLARRVAAYEQHTVASVRIRDTQYCQARVKLAVRAYVIDQRRLGIGGWREDKTYKTRDLVGAPPGHRDAIFGKSLPGSSPCNALRPSGIRAKRSGTGQRNTGSIVRNRACASPSREGDRGRGKVNADDVPADFVVIHRPSQANRKE